MTLFLRGGGPGGLSVLEHVVDQHVVGAVTFPPVDISGAPRPNGPVAGASLPTTTSFWIEALATDPTGTTWMGVGDSLEYRPTCPSARRANASGSNPGRRAGRLPRGDRDGFRCDGAA